MNPLITLAYIEQIRTTLYPLGFISLILFSARFVLQWYQSEKRGVSHVSKSFWHLSWLGNITLALHAFIQLHFVIFFIQSLQTFISVRNLNLLSSTPIQKKTFIKILLCGALCSFLLYTSQKYLLPPETFTYLRIPKRCAAQPDLPSYVHILGILSLITFSLRFWIQWYEAEKAQTSHLSKRFFTIGSIGSLGSSLYFAATFDPVNCIGPLCASIASIRNIILQNACKKPSVDIVLIAGETSGDLLGKSIIQSLKHNYPTLKIGGGIAGQSMRTLGIEPWIQSERFQVLGIVDVLKKSFSIFWALRKTLRKIIETQPKIVVCIDQPSFSLALAKRLRSKGYKGKIVQVVAPTVWAYKPKRASLFATYFDLLLPLYHFEIPYFSSHMKTVWVGHPITEHLPFKKQPSSNPILALFPGSRKGEVQRNLPLQLEAALLLKKSHPHLGISISAARGMETLITGLAKKSLNDQFELVDFEDRYLLMQKACIAIAKSGTVTLELALHEVPLACCYETGLLTRLYAQYVLGIKKQSFALPNILTGENVVPEFVIPPIDPKKIALSLEPFIHTPSALPSTVKSKIVQQIHPGTTSADLIAREISCLVS